MSFRVEPGAEAATLFGRGSVLHEMLRFARNANKTSDIWAIALDDLGAGVAGVQTITVTVTTAEPGTISLYINGGNVRYGPEDFYTNAFPMRLTADEPVRISAYGFLYIVRKGSPYAQICRELIAGLTCPEDGQPRRCMLFREVAQSQYGTPDFSYNPNGDVLTRKWQEQYRPEWLFFDVEPFFQARQVQRSEGAMYRFAGGGLTAEEFAATLDGSVRAMAAAFELADFGVYTPVIRATVYEGLYLVGAAVLNGTFHRRRRERQAIRKADTNDA